MEYKQTLLIMIAIVAVVGIVGFTLNMAMGETGAYVYRHNPRPRPGDWDYASQSKPYSNAQSMPTQQDTFIIPQTS
ncbi:hypothetical protein GF343_00990 [Candidatus Woesearchaeota archaeon]|nr:hypothetical protein [Candidatus Woesearchaeota archaeon]